MLGFRLCNGEVVIFDKESEKQYGTLKTYLVRPGNDNFYRPSQLEPDNVAVTEKGFRISWNCKKQGVSVALELLPISSGFSGRLYASGKGSGIIRLVWEISDGDEYFPFVPAFMYGNNEGGKSPWATYPQLGDDISRGFDKPWVSDEWLMRTDRSSHGFAAFIGKENTYALGGRDVCFYEEGSHAEKTGLGISSSKHPRISFSLGFSNVPYTYSVIHGRNYFGRPDGYINMEKGSVYADIFIYESSNKTFFNGITKLLRESYWLLHDDIKHEGTVKEAITAISQALVDYGYCKAAENFYITLSDNNTDANEENLSFNTAWAGGLRTAYPLLLAGHQFKNKNWLQCARNVFDNISQNAISSISGLFYENYELKTETWSSKGWWYRMLENPGHSGYVNGQACYYLLAAYQYEIEHGDRQDTWLKSAWRVLDRIVLNQGEDGHFGYTYNEKDGTILDNNGFCGCWFTPALALLYKTTGDKRYLRSAQRAMDYYRNFVEGFNVYGGPHDIFKSPDEEGILAFIKAAHIMHVVTGEERYLEDLLMGLEYEFSWKFSYNVVNEIEPLKSKGWCSTGGSVTSVNNSHIHPMGSSILDSIAYAVKELKDDYLKSRLIDTLKWTLTVYLHQDGDYDWGRKGMINERFCYTDSLLAERYPDGSPASTWFCAHSWASGAVLEGLVEYAQNNNMEVE